MGYIGIFAIAGTRYEILVIFLSSILQIGSNIELTPRGNHGIVYCVGQGIQLDHSKSQFSCDVFRDSCAGVKEKLYLEIIKISENEHFKYYPETCSYILDIVQNTTSLAENDKTTIANSTGMIGFNISSNNLTNIPCFGHDWSEGLKWLDFSYNRISQLNSPLYFGKPPNSVNYLILKGNQIHQTHPFAFRNLTSLNILDVSANVDVVDWAFVEYSTSLKLVNIKDSCSGSSFGLHCTKNMTFVVNANYSSCCSSDFECRKVNSRCSFEYNWPQFDLPTCTPVPPTMSLKINEITLKQSYYWVPQNELMVITCFAWDAMPKVNLSWVTNGRDRIYTQLKVTEGDAPTYNSTSLLSYIPTQENSSISCYGNSVISSEYHVEVSLYTYVFPELYITLNGERVEKEFVNSGENLNVTCHADEARPVSSLSFNDRNEVVTELPPITNTSTSISFLLMKRLEQENITCTSTQRREGESDLTKFVTVTVTVPEKSTTQPEKPTTQPDSPTKDPPSSGFDYLQWIIPSIATLLTCFVFVCIYKLTTKIRALMSEFSTDADTTHLKLNSLPADQSLAHYSSQVCLQKKQKSALPSIPRDEISYNHFSSSESIYYSAEKESTPKDRIFSENEFCILTTIKVGTIYNRWMGTIKTPNKIAVLTTIAEGVMKKQINWDAFVKRTLDLPTTDHLTRIEGIAVDKTTLYLVTERTVCETLKSHLTFDPSSQSSPFSVSDVMKHIAAILEGIECLQSYGFLHPGLSTKKILYTNEGICKLYDFCLAEDAPKVVMLKKTQMNTVTFNQLPPESFFRNEYTAESDVWSTAVVIWEILSSGETPFPVDEDIQPGQNVNAPMLKWPQRCFQLRNLVLFDCWSQTCSLRPSIHYLKESFKAIFETLRENSFYEIPRSGLYMPMSGVTNYS